MAGTSDVSIFNLAEIFRARETPVSNDLEGFEGIIAKNVPLSFTLVFEDTYFEARFRKYYNAVYYRYAQATLTLGIFLIFLDFLADFVALPHNAANFLRLTVCIPIVGFGVAVSFTNQVRERWQTVMSALIVAIAISLFLTLQKIDAENGMGLSSWVGVFNYVILEIYCFVILGLGLRHAFFAGGLITLAFEAAVFNLQSGDLRMFAYLSYQIVTMFIITLAIGWWREYVLRKDFSAQDSLLTARRALAQQNATLEHAVERRTRELKSSQDAAILALASLCDTRDNETGNHIRRTQHYVLELARQLNEHPRFQHYLTDEQMEILFKSAPLHDIGKVGIPDSILRKPGPLDREEFELMKTHTTLGFVDTIESTQRQLGERAEFLGCVQEIALNHHEKWDGSGYPRKLVGDRIPISARLMALADVYDALTSKRVYKDAFPQARAIEIIREGRGSHFDPDIVDAFLQITDKFEVIARRYAG